MTKKKLKQLPLERMLEITLLLAVICITLIMIISASYTYLCEDDFSWLCGQRDIIEEFGVNPFIASIKGAVGYYFSNEGSFFANFLSYFLNPYKWLGLPGFHAVMVGILLLYVFSLYYLLSCIFQRTLFRYFYLLVMLVFSFCIYCTGGVRELFNWFTGACYYTIELSLSFISLGHLIKIIRTKNISAYHIIVASIAGFFASGGNLIVAAINCSMILLVMIMCSKPFYKIVRYYCPFVFSVIGALINLAGPGNYIRADSHIIEGHSTVLDALRDNVVLIAKASKEVLASRIFILGLFAILVIVYKSKPVFENVNLNTSKFILSWIAGLVMLYVAMFPDALGAHTDELTSMRLHQIFLMYFSLLCVFAVTVTGLWLKNLQNQKKLIILCVIAIISMSLLFIPKRTPEQSDIKKGFATCVVRDLKSGNLRDNYAMRSYILETLDIAEEGSDVILFLPYYPCDSTYGMGIGEDPNSFVNDTVEAWKRIKSLTVYYIGLTYPAE